MSSAYFPFCRRLARIEEVGDGPGKSFFSLRKAQIALKSGSPSESLRYAEQAIKNTPNLQAAYAAKARALLAYGDLESAWEAVRAVEYVGSKKSRLRDGLENLVLFQVRFEYNQSKGEFALCKKDIDNVAEIDADLARAMKRELAHTISNAGVRLDRGLIAWLKL